MFSKIRGVGRDLIYWIKDQEDNIKCSLMIYSIAGFIITSIAYGISSAEKVNYCNWKPNRFPTAIYWTIEYPIKKVSCFVWQPWNNK